MGSGTDCIDGTPLKKSFLLITFSVIIFSNSVTDVEFN